VHVHLLSLCVGTCTRVVPSASAHRRPRPSLIRVPSLLPFPFSGEALLRRTDARCTAGRLGRVARSREAAACAACALSRAAADPDAAAASSAAAAAAGARRSGRSARQRGRIQRRKSSQVKSIIQRRGGGQQHDGRRRFGGGSEARVGSGARLACGRCACGGASSSGGGGGGAACAGIATWPRTQCLSQRCSSRAMDSVWWQLGTAHAASARLHEELRASEGELTELHEGCVPRHPPTSHLPPRPLLRTHPPTPTRTHPPRTAQATCVHIECEACPQRLSPSAALCVGKQVHARVGRAAAAARSDGRRARTVRGAARAGRRRAEQPRHAEKRALDTMTRPVSRAR
jgi:hypothetical protein